ncbi:MAG TPA: hypothetical protein PKD63_00080 [Solirubrobacteraceae bacterium]|nr:hypothetical protein [Solirubrobacteraceae bacterium]
MTLDPAGLEAAAKALHMWEHGDPIDYAEPDYRECVEVAVRAYLAAAVPPTAENSAERDHIRRALQKLHDTGLLDVGTATGVALAAAQHAAVAAARAAATPDPPDEAAIRADERERLSARVYENGWCPTCGRTVGES